MKHDTASAEKRQNEHPPHKPLCFVVGPIGVRGTRERKRSDMLLRYIIHQALAEEYNVKRADEDARPGLITHHVIQDIYEADLIIADLSRLNPNAFYELGVAHALMKKIVHVCDVDTDLPFDIKDYRAVSFDPTDPDSHEIATKQLKNHVVALQTVKDILNPVTSAIGRKEAIDKSSVTETTLSKLFQDVDDLKSSLSTIQQQRLAAAPEPRWRTLEGSEERDFQNKTIAEYFNNLPYVRGWHIDQSEKKIRVRLDKRSLAKAEKVMNDVKVFVRPFGFTVYSWDEN